MIDSTVESFTSLEKFGFQRSKCASCGKQFWRTSARFECSEFPCGPYRYKECSPRRVISLDQIRESFLSFFESKGHRRLHPAPLVASWRSDVFFTQASIYGFQPHVVQGYVKPQANPVVISQPCLRFNDLELIGRSPGHLTLFEMMGNHAFNYKDQPIYGEETTIAYAIEYLTGSLQLSIDELEFKEATWAGGGSSGPCVEVIFGGLEIATLVFSTSDQAIAGLDTPTKIVDTGYGLERLCLVVNGCSNVFEIISPALLSRLLLFEHLEYHNQITHEFVETCNQTKIQSFEDVLQIIEELARITNNPIARIHQQLEHFFAINQLLDHLRATVMLLRERLVPSNTGQGYYLRMLIRRLFDLLHQLHLDLPLETLLLIQLESYRTIDREIPLIEPFLRMIIQTERTRYEQTLERAKRLLKQTLQAGSELSVEQATMLYQSHGIRPFLIRECFPSLRIEAIEQLEALVRRTAIRGPAPPRISCQFPSVPATKLQTLTAPYQSFEAKVLHQEGQSVILDQTAFQPAIDGFPGDRGSIEYQGRGHLIKSIHYQEQLIIHELSELNPKEQPLEAQDCVIRGFISKEYHTHAVDLHAIGHLIMDLLFEQDQTLRVIEHTQTELIGSLIVQMTQKPTLSKLKQQLHSLDAETISFHLQMNWIDENPLQIFAQRLDLRRPMTLVRTSLGAFRLLCGAPHPPSLQVSRIELRTLIECELMTYRIEYQIR